MDVLQKARMDRKRLRDALAQIILEVDHNPLDKTLQHQLDHIKEIAAQILSETEEPGGENP